MASTVPGLGDRLIPGDQGYSFGERRRHHEAVPQVSEQLAVELPPTPAEAYPLLLSVPYFDLYRKQVVKQADLVLAMYLRGDAFTPEQKARNFSYYEARTVRDSSLSAGPQGVIAAEVGHLDLAYDYWAETALVDLHDLQHNTGAGLHIAALAGAWTVAVAGSVACVTTTGT